MRIPFLLIFFGSLCALSLFSCKKTIEETVHIDTTLTGNNVPPYDGVSDVEIDNYINKIFIDLIGREPTTTELSTDHQYLEDHQLDDAARDHIVQQIINTPAFYKHLFASASTDFTNSVDSATIADEVALIEYVAYLDSIQGYTQNAIYYEYELNRLHALQSAAQNYQSGSISVNEFFAAFLNNYFYDQVNMGSDNFVKGSFDDLFLRAATDAELASGVTMVDNQPSIIFLQSGESKGDYINIVTSCHEFYEGLVKKTFLLLLLRNPNSTEMGQYTLEFETSDDFLAFEKEIVKSKEYAGF